MTLEASIALALAVLVFAATPGPAIMACVAQALSNGFRSSLGLIVGIVLGDLLFLLFAIYGLSAIAQVLGQLFLIVKLVGGAYLVWLGWTMWNAEPTPADAAVEGERGGWSGFTAGLVVTLSNPKVILFYLGFLPAFMDLTRLRALDVAVVAGVVTAVLLGVNVAYAYSASRARRVFTSRRALRNVNRGAGTVMIGTGLVVISR